MFSYCVFAREQIRRQQLDQPAIVVIVSGTKELWTGDVCERLPAGIPFVMPAGTSFDIVNIPDSRTGRYESVCMNVDAELRGAIRQLPGMAAEQPSPARGRMIELTPDLVEAYGHAATTVADPRHGPALARHRILEILMLVRSSPAARLLFAASIVERAELVLRSDPGRAWRVEDLARALGLGASTLRRRLAREATSFRDLLLATRMAAAGNLLGSPAYSVTQAAEAVGYSSRSHFARRFRAAHGMPPSKMRASG
ncbi:AraC family transcriptional regulator [Sphingomonas oleivorans]|uniref:AraC family transcriptional regulator n=1 Tax=Sphingomonas oleivorans TaxID=1735121 RepID=UPI0013FD4C5D|nr:AraC family transcriptional regulator [Sphingomonas oleivorans]